MELNKRSRALLFAYNKGYRIINGKIINPKGKTIKGHNANGYLNFGVNTKEFHDNVPVHRLLAYQKYGNQILEEGIVVRHLDGNSLNNLEENIVIGTQSDNMMDKTPEALMLVVKFVNFQIK